VIEITPTHDEYDQLVTDLARLRERGASSNTVAVVEAVHAVAQGRMVSEKEQTPGGAGRPRHGSRRLSPDAGKP
jgi:hypothetical protein